MSTSTTIILTGADGGSTESRFEQNLADPTGTLFVPDRTDVEYTPEELGRAIIDLVTQNPAAIITLIPRDL